MKKIIIILFIICLSTFSAYAQEVEEKTTNDSEVIDITVDMEREMPEYIRVGVGLKYGILKPDFSNLNQYLTDANLGFKALPEDLTLIGLEALGGLRAGNRFGVYGMYGQNSTKGAKGEKLKFEVAYGGLLYQRGLYLRKNTDIAAALGLGIGRSSLELLHYLPDNSEEAIAKPTGTTLKQTFLVLEPELSLYQQLTPALALEFSIGYLLSSDINNSWTLNGYEFKGDLGEISSPIFNLKFSFGI